MSCWAGSEQWVHPGLFVKQLLLETWLIIDGRLNQNTEGVCHETAKTWNALSHSLVMSPQWPIITGNHLIQSKYWLVQLFLHVSWTFSCCYELKIQFSVHRQYWLTDLVSLQTHVTKRHQGSTGLLAMLPYNQESELSFQLTGHWSFFQLLLLIVSL